MDTSPEYIKMCKRAYEIQEFAKDLPMHENDGEYVCAYEGTRSFCPKCKTWVHVDYCGWCGKKKKEEDAVFLTYRNQIPPIDKFGYIWLPRQDQLQEILYADRNENGKTYYMLVEAHAFVIHGKDNGLWSMEQLWLAFVMYRKFDKVWDGKDYWQRRRREGAEE